MKVVVLNTNKKYCDLISANIGTINKTHNNINIIQAVNLEQLENYIDLFDDIDLLYTDQLPKDNSLKDIDLKIISFGKKANSPVEVAELIYEKLIELRHVKEFVKQEYFQASLSLFYYISQIPCDIYIKIKKSNKIEFVKRFNKDSGIEQSDIKKYEQKGLDYFYIESSDTDLFLKVVNKRIDSMIPNEKSFSQIEDMQSFIINQVKDLGINSSLLKMANDSTNESIKILSSKKGLLSMLSSVMKSFNDYRFQHSYMTLIFSNLILKKMTWSTKQHVSDITTAAFFHDVALDKAEEMMIQSVEELNDSLTLSKKALLIEQHALLGYELLKKNKDIQDGALRIIKEHHGDTNGLAFKSTFASNISQLSKVFILSEYIANDIILNEEGNKNLSSIIERVNYFYGADVFKKEITALKQSI